MKRRCRSIYQLARKNAGLTQEQAAELLNISVRSLIDYEAGVTVPNGDIVCSMVKVYKARWLGYEHLRQSSDLGKLILPPIKIEDLAKAVLVLQKESSDVEAIKNSMITIACDSKVENHEEQRWREVTKEVFEMAGAALSVVYSR